jgi:hypothetical protein
VLKRTSRKTAMISQENLATPSTSTLDIADLPEKKFIMYQLLQHLQGSKCCAVNFIVCNVLYIYFISVLFFHHSPY